MLIHKETKQQIKKPGREKAVPTWHYSELGGSEWLGGHKTPTRHSGKGQQVASQTEQMKNTENTDRLPSAYCDKRPGTLHLSGYEKGT